jgi:hypothetical protein
MSKNFPQFSMKMLSSPSRAGFKQNKKIIEGKTPSKKLSKSFEFGLFLPTLR